MERTRRPRVIIDKDGWKQVQLESDFLMPVDVKDQEAYLNREKLNRYVNNHPERILHYIVGNQEYTVDCKCSEYLIRRFMSNNGASSDDIEIAVDIGHQFQYFYGHVMVYTKKAFAGGTSKYQMVGGVLDSKSDELLDLFGRLHSVDEVCRIIVQDWGFSVHRNTVQAFYTRNLKEIEKLRDQYVADYSDLSLSKKRARLDKLSIMFHTYFEKWHKDPRLEYAKEIRATIEQIRREVEGDNINLNVQGQINVDLTIEVNKTLAEAYKRIPVNNLILAMVAAKRGIDPTKLMTQLTTSHYRSLTGYGQYEPEKELLHPVDLTYNWNEIERKHRTKDKSISVEEAKIVVTAGSIEKDAEMSNIKNKLMELLEIDKTSNSRRKSK